MARTYLPTLIKFLDRICSYLADHRDIIVASSDTTVPALIDTFVMSCHALRDAVAPYDPPGA